MVSTEKIDIVYNVIADLLVTNFTILYISIFTENRIQLISSNLIQRSNILEFKQIMCTSEKNKTRKAM